MYRKLKDAIRNPLHSKFVILKHISNITFRKIKQKKVIMCFDGYFDHGGLVDRLKGIISFYEAACQAGIEFKIFHKVPYELTEFLIPNLHDWVAKKDDMKWNPFSTKFIYGMQDFRMHPLKKIANNSCNTFFVYYNVDFLGKLLPNKTDEDIKQHWSLRFNQLFKQSPYLEQQMNNLDLPPKAIAIHTRFISIVGDFVDNSPLQVLNNLERDKLFCDLVNAIEKTKVNYLDQEVFVFSDSITYLNFIKKNTPYRVIEGVPLHPDNRSRKFELERHLKTFLDFFAIANCKEVVLIRKDFMHPSAYPLYATYINKACFKEIII